MKTLTKQELKKLLEPIFGNQYRLSVENFDALKAEVSFYLKDTKQLHLSSAVELLSLDWYMHTHARPDITEKEIRMYIDTFM